MSEDLDERLLAHVGREQTFTAPEPLGEAAGRYFALATADANPLYGGTERAGLSRHRGMIAPPTLICETNQILGGEPGRGSDGVEWNLPLEGRRFMRSGNTYEFVQPARPGDRVSVTWRIVDIVARRTSSGESAVFVTSRADYTNQKGETLASNVEANVYLK